MDEPLFNYTLHLADNNLIMGHRLSEWTGHGPMLEQDIAMSNIALDLIGQSRNFYQYAASLKGEQVTEDTLAYLRDVREFKNLLITEIPNGDWAITTLKLFLFSSYQYFFYKNLVGSSDKQLAAIAEKSLKEITYHVRWSSEWVIRLGDGTGESNRRLKLAVEEVWPFTGEIFESADYEMYLLKERISVPVRELKIDWQHTVKEVLDEATLMYPPENMWMQKGGKAGIHTEYLGHILAEMQFLQRAYPGCEW